MRGLSAAKKQRARFPCTSANNLLAILPKAIPNTSSTVAPDWHQVPTKTPRTIPGGEKAKALKRAFFTGLLALQKLGKPRQRKLGLLRPSPAHYDLDVIGASSPVQGLIQKSPPHFSLANSRRPPRPGCRTVSFCATSQYPRGGLI